MNSNAAINPAIAPLIGTAKMPKIKRILPWIGRIAVVIDPFQTDRETTQRTDPHAVEEQLVVFHNRKGEPEELNILEVIGLNADRSDQLIHKVKVKQFATKEARTGVRAFGFG